MLYGLQNQIRQLVENLKGGNHTLVFGPRGVGKTSVLVEAARLINVETNSHLLAVYVENSSSNHSILESAKKSLQREGLDNDNPFGRWNSNSRYIPVRDLRNFLLHISKTRKICLLLDHLPRLRHPMEHLFELLTPTVCMAFALTAGFYECDLFYWKCCKIELKNLPRETAQQWLMQELTEMGYRGSLKKELVQDMVMLTKGNPNLCSMILRMIRRQTVMLQDRLQIRHLYVDALSAHLNQTHGNRCIR